MRLRVVHTVAQFGLTLFLAGLLAGVLIRYAPGSMVDARELDARLSAESRDAVRAERAGQLNLVRFYAEYLSGLVRGDLGTSETLHLPVRELLAERFPLTLRSIAIGLLWGWLMGVWFAAMASYPGLRWLDAGFSLFCGGVLSIPSALLAFAFLLASGPVWAALAMVVFPKVYRYARNLLLKSLDAPHVEWARSSGIGEWRILWRYCLPPVAAELVALAGVSVNTAFGAVIPMEVITDQPGVGQLVWLAAMGRDLPVLVNLTLVVTAVTLAANGLAGLVGPAEQARPARESR